MRFPSHPLVALSVLALLLAATGCTNDDRALWQGYVEGEFVYVSPPLGGRLDDLFVTKGQTVETGQPLFALERTRERAEVDEASQQLDAALSALADKRKGSRPSEIDAIKARLKDAEAAEALAAVRYERRAELFRASTISEEELDDARTTQEQAAQRVRNVAAELKTALLGSRSDAVRAAEADVEAARARLEQARWAHDQKIQSATCPGLVFDTIFQEGEWVPAGRPVVSILPPENRMVRFYVPEPLVGGFAVGDGLLLSFDGLENPIPMTLTYISPEGEYTPPVIYSSQSRSKLVFLLEARPAPAQAALLKPGLPVDVARFAGDLVRRDGLLARLWGYFGGNDD